MIKYLLVFQLVFCVCSAWAVEQRLSVEFEYTDTADSFRMYERMEQGKQILTDSADGTVREMSWTQELGTDCHTYFMVAISGGVESLPSNAITWCPETTLPEYVSRPNTVTIQGPITITIGE